jgi:aminopeptidase N
VAVGLLNPNGDEVVPTTVLELTQTEQAFDFTGLAARPTASILRGFSAPVVLNRQVAARERAFLLAHDTDPFNRWEAGRSLAKEVLMGRADSAPLIEGLARVALDDSLDAAFRALTLRLPGDDDMAATMAAAGGEPDPDEIYAARRRLHLALARKLAPHLPALSAPIAGAFSPTADQAGQRALRLSALGVWARLDLAPLRAAHLSANNMTEEVGTLAHLLENGTGQDEVARFEARWQGERLVMDKWFSLQILCAAPDQAAAVTAKLTQHKLFDWKNPNRFRAVFGALSGNHAGFHNASGAGYALLADWLIKLDPLNPQTAARMSGAYETWARYDAGRQALIKGQLARIAAAPGISRNLAEMVARMIG